MSTVLAGGSTKPQPADTLRALVVFARFPDNYDRTFCDTTATGWPDPSVPPAWADSVIEDVDVPVIPGSLTHYFHTMSGGQHVLKGTVHDSVITLDYGIAYYDSVYAGNANNMVMAANANVVSQVIPAMDTDALNYDLNGDGFFDQMFIYYRSPAAGPNGPLIHKGKFSAIALLVPADTTYTLSSGSISLGQDDGVFVTWGAYIDGSTNVRYHNRWQFLQIAAHEYGHHLLWFGHHIETMGPFDLMDGTTPLAEGAAIPQVSGWNRWKGGWIDPATFSPATVSADTTITLRDSVLDPDQGFAIVRARDPDSTHTDQFFLLECRTGKSDYFTLQGFGDCPTLAQPTGLLISHVVRTVTVSVDSFPPTGFVLGNSDSGWDGWNPPGGGGGDLAWRAPAVDPELATGMFASNGTIDPEWGADNMQANEEYTTDKKYGVVGQDLFQGGDGDSGFSNCFTPYTNPSTAFYRDSTYVLTNPFVRTLVQPHVDQTVYSGIHIYDIQWANAGRDSMYVSLRFDGMTEPAGADTIRSSTTWAGRVQLTGDVVVASGATLTVAEEAEVIASAAQDGAADGIDTTRTEIIVQGQLAVNGAGGTEAVFTSSRDALFDHFRGPEATGAAAGDWYGIRALDADSVAVDSTSVRYARTGLAFNDPGLTLAQLQDALDPDNDVSSSTSVVDVSLERDFTVGSTQTLEVPAGVRLGFAAGRDEGASGRANALVELAVQGVLKVLGDSTSTTALQSDHPSPTSEDWYGLQWDYQGSSQTGYGYSGTLDWAEVADSRYGVEIQSSVSPSLKNVTFSNQATAEIHVDSTDVEIPFNGGWNLPAGTRVLVEPGVRTGKDLILSGDTLSAGKATILAHGKLNAAGAFGDSVSFQPNVGTPVLGNYWGGVYLNWTAAGSVIDHAKIGYASDPLYAYSQNGSTPTRVSNSLIHNFEKQGIWVYQSQGAGVEILDNVVDRNPSGGTFSSFHGQTGMRLERADVATVSGNTVDLSGVVGEGGSGLLLRNSKTFCESGPSSADSVVVSGNTFHGPALADAPSESTWAGITADWACGHTNRAVYIAGNSLNSWSRAGFYFWQSSDVQVTCNETDSVRTAVEFSRNTSANGSGVRFRHNDLFVQDVSYGDSYGARTDNAKYVKMGPNPTGKKGLNRVELDAQDFYFDENDASADTLDARNNYWLRDAILGDADSVRTYSTRTDNSHSDPWRLDPTGAQTSDPFLSNPCAVFGARIAASGPGPAEAQAEDRPPTGDIVRLGLSVPLSTLLEAVRPNPFGARADVRFAVAPEQEGAVFLAVYDVQGRRIRTLLDGPTVAGRYALAWDGRSGSGVPVPSGVYFVRLVAAGYQKTQKVAVIR